MNLQKTFKEYILEDFNDIGRLTKKQLSKGNALNKDADNFKEVTGRVFYQSIKSIKKNDLLREFPKGLDSLGVYDVKEYRKMRCFIGSNNSSGFALNGNELVSVFSSQKSSGSAIVTKAIQEGAKSLDCFAKDINGKIEGALFRLYSKFGFKIDKSFNSGEVGEAYSIQNGISRFVDENDIQRPEREEVVIFMKLK